jgi:hypothetical protein
MNSDRLSEGAPKRQNYRSISDASVSPLETTVEVAGALKSDGSKVHGLQFWLRATAWTAFASFIGFALYRSSHRGVFEYIDAGSPLLGARSNAVRVYQTSMGSSERMALLTESSLKNMGVEVTKIAFGNAFICPKSGAASSAGDAGSADTDGADSSLPPQCNDEVSSLSIDSSTKYQVSPVSMYSRRHDVNLPLCCPIIADYYRFRRSIH